MEIKMLTAPFDSVEFLDLVEKTFGREERELEEVQINGSESKYNSDVVFISIEEDTILGTLHVTIPNSAPYLAGLSAMLTTPEARGKGIGTALFSEAMKFIDSKGIELAVLGTSNPIAAKMYSKFGFSYAFGSGVMMRFSAGHQVDFNNNYLDSPCGNISVKKGDPSLRIPIVPLTLYKTGFLINDLNTNLVSFEIMTQFSCMGLFPRYLNLYDKGGDFYYAADERGVVGAVASVLPSLEGNRVDFFFSHGFESSLRDLISAIETDRKNIFFEVAKNDAIKANIVKALDYTAEAESSYEYRGFSIPTVKYSTKT